MSCQSRPKPTNIRKCLHGGRQNLRIFGMFCIQTKTCEFSTCCIQTIKKNIVPEPAETCEYSSLVTRGPPRPSNIQHALHTELRKSSHIHQRAGLILRIFITFCAEAAPNLEIFISFAPGSGLNHCTFTTNHSISISVVSEPAETHKYSKVFARGPPKP